MPGRQPVIVRPGIMEQRNEVYTQEKYRASTPGNREEATSPTTVINGRSNRSPPAIRP